MSVSIKWRIVTPSESQRAPGTSSDLDTFRATFGERNLTNADAPMLQAMHRAITSSVFADRETLWGKLAEALAWLPDGTEIEVWGEW
jgi:hypothetical protein